LANLSGEARAGYVQDMFARIAPRYDLMNRLMTAGQDGSWRREVIRRAELPPGGALLDLGTGTGDLAMEAKLQCPDCRPIAADFTLEMMRVGQGRPRADLLHWSAADTLDLPFPEHTFDAVVSGFLMRNVGDIARALREQYRVLKPGGQLVILDTTRPPENLISPFIRFHLHVIIPTLGRLITGHSEAYTYLPESTEKFLRAEALVAHLARAGFRQIGFRRRMLGTVAIHWGARQE
jgi:demethylmenaquinone methyltransferase/2-methoxy-6-polyprenyl-1,4-benzoquinol methylase